jgi:hypothetical protein
VLGVTGVDALAARTKIEFLLPPVDDESSLRIDAACDLLVASGLAPSMPYLRKGSQLVEVKDRAASLRAELRKKNPQLFVSASGNRQVGVDSTFLRGSADPWSRLVFCLGIHCRPLPWPDQERLMVEAGDLLHALSGFAIPYDSWAELMTDSALYRSKSSDGHEALEKQCRGLRDSLGRTGTVLPSIQPVVMGGTLTNRAQPEALGWINYWSAETCTYLGFPDDAREGELLRLSHRTPAGAWLVKLTEEPLDIRRDEHVTVLARIYERFPKLGIRTPGSVTANPVPRAPTGSAVAPQDAFAIVGTGDVAAVRNTVTALLADSSATNRVTVAPGAPGWSLLTADPTELLADDLGYGRPLLVELCQRLRVVGCMLAVRGPVDAVLLESDAAGRSRVSGGFLSDAERARGFHGIAVPGDPVRFDLMPFEADLLDLDDYTQLLEMLRAEFSGR